MQIYSLDLFWERKKIILCFPRIQEQWYELVETMRKIKKNIWKGWAND